MSRRFSRLSLWLVLLLSSEVWAIGLGDIQLDSALNEPLRTEIVLLSASADELSDLRVAPASAETFTRYGTTDGGDVVVQKGATLWGLAARNRPDSRLTMSQTMLAIYEANQGAFIGNINRLRAGATLRIPSADEVFQISRGDALNQVQRQHSAWSGGSGYTASDQSTRPSLVLVPPDEDPAGIDYTASSSTSRAAERIEEEIALTNLEYVETILVGIKASQEQKQARQRATERAVAAAFADDANDISRIYALMADDTTTADDSATNTTIPTNIVSTSSSSDTGIVDTILEFLAPNDRSIGSLIILIGALIWFMRSGDDNDGMVAGAELDGATKAVDWALVWTTDDAGAEAGALDMDFGAQDSGSEEAETMLAPLDEDDEFDFAKTEALPPEAFTSNMDLEATAEMPAIAGTDVDLDLDDLTAALQVSEIGDTIEQPRDDATVEKPRPSMPDEMAEEPTMSLAPEDMSSDLHEARTMTQVGTKLDLARAYVDMGDPAGAHSILEEVLDEGDDGQKQQAQQLLDSLPS